MKGVSCWLCAGVWLWCGCQTDLERMLDQKKAKPFAASPVFSDGKAMRARPRVARWPSAPASGPAELVEGRKEGRYVDRIPIPIDERALERGEQRFQVFCRACHGPLGDAQSPVADAMELRRPPSLYEPRLVALPAGALYRVISEGFGLCHRSPRSWHRGSAGPWSRTCRRYSSARRPSWRQLPEICSGRRRHG
jgi:hypothetical protein